MPHRILSARYRGESVAVFISRRRNYEAWSFLEEGLVVALNGARVRRPNTTHFLWPRRGLTPKRKTKKMFHFKQKGETN